MNARGIPTTAYQVLHPLSYPVGGRGLPILARGYLPWPGGGYLPWLGGVPTWLGGGYLPGWGSVPTLARGYLPFVRGYLPWPGGTYPGGGLPHHGTPAKVSTPPAKVDTPPPPSKVQGRYSQAKVGAPRCEQTENITFPRPSDAVGNYFLLFPDEDYSCVIRVVGVFLRKWFSDKLFKKVWDQSSQII